MGRLKPKNDVQAIAAPKRVAQVIGICRQQAKQAGLSQAIWRTMIAAFI